MCSQMYVPRSNEDSIYVKVNSSLVIGDDYMMPQCVLDVLLIRDWYKRIALESWKGTLLGLKFQKPCLACLFKNS